MDRNRDVTITARVRNGEIEITGTEMSAGEFTDLTANITYAGYYQLKTHFGAETTVQEYAQWLTEYMTALDKENEAQAANA